jgi:16S rRNA processing protein RimM
MLHHLPRKAVATEPNRDRRTRATAAKPAPRVLAASAEAEAKPSIAAPPREIPPPLDAPLEEWDVLVGRVTGHWDKALLKAKSFSPDPARFRDGIYFCAVTGSENGSESRRLLTVRASRFSGNQWILECGLKSTEEAVALRGAELFIHPSMRPELGDANFYVDELLGVRIETENGEDFGEIEEILETPAHDVYVTDCAMIPGHPDFIVRLDLEARVLVVRDLPGLRTDEA